MSQDEPMGTLESDATPVGTKEETYWDSSSQPPPTRTFQTTRSQQLFLQATKSRKKKKAWPTHHDLLASQQATEARAFADKVDAALVRPATLRQFDRHERHRFGHEADRAIELISSSHVLVA